MSLSDDIIDLTRSFTLADHCGLSNVVIDLDTDDSLLNDLALSVDATCVKSNTQNANNSPVVAKRRKNVKKKFTPRKSVPPAPPSTSKSEQDKFGSCPICWEDLGKNPLASTKCGHVYCMKCLQKYVRIQKRCPTCRKSLKGSEAYHPLYLG